MSAISFVNLLLSVIHIVALAMSVIAYGILAGSVLQLFARRRVNWSYPKIEVCISVMSLSAIAVWLSALPGAVVLTALPARHFSIFGMLNLELFILSGAALLFVVNRAQDRYATKSRLISSRYEALALKLVIACGLASLLMMAFQIIPDTWVPQSFAVLAADAIISDLLFILVLLTLLVFVLLLAINDNWLNYRFTRSRNHNISRFTDNDLNLLNNRSAPR